MNTLTLEEINPYLPYKLAMQYTNTGKVGFVSNIYTIGNGYDDKDLKLSIDFSEGEHIWMYKPILFPLSCLDQEITVNGETFCPIQLLQNEKYPIDYFLDNTEAVTYFHSWYKSN